MSKHVFTVAVECTSTESYDEALAVLTSIGEILDEESDFQ